MSKKTSLRRIGGREAKTGKWATVLMILLLIVVAVLLWILIRMGTEEIPGESHREESKIEESEGDESLEESRADSKADLENSEPESRQESEQDSQQESRQESQQESSDGGNETIDISLFDDAVFIGDSRTQGLQMATGLTNARFLAERSMAVNRCEQDYFRLSDGRMGNMYQALAEKQYNKVYIMFGVNELGWPSAATFAERYGQVIDKVRQIQPDATIYVQSILPITKERSDRDNIYNNENVNAFNAEIEKMVQERDVVYLDVASVFRDDSGALFADAATDGIHMNFDYCKMWLKYLAENQR